MPFIDWSDDMCVGEPMIDDQHKNLVNLINDIDDATRRYVSHAEVSEYMQRFFKYMMDHMQEEESLMDQSTYKQYFTHVQEHIEFSQKTMDFYKKFIDDQKVDIQELLNYLVSWFINHTTVMDRTLALHLLEKGVKH
jgi:hemerythrin-like metal-binding protein